MSDFEIKFGKDFEKKVMAEARKGMVGMEIDYECPECGKPMTIEVGATRPCPSCGFEVTAQLD